MQPPPLMPLIAYRLLGWRLGPDYREWVHSDITRRGWTLRQAVPGALAFGALLAIVFAASGSSPQRLVIPILGVLVLAVFLRNPLMERALRQQGLDLDGKPTASWYDDHEERLRRNKAGSIGTVLLIGAAMALLVFSGDR
ncbi:MAG TPA: DUF5313 family protein [Mycobacteriales bacterium]|nr:DUF5313 family protein [Mycobacteriales bacterium]